MSSRMSCAGFLYRAFAVLALAGAAFHADAQDIQLALPIACELGRTCYIQNYTDLDPSPSARDYKCGTLTYDNHNGTDFRLPSLAAQKTGVEVRAAAGGRILRIRNDAPDDAFTKSGREAVREAECGNGVIIEHPEQWETQYCHLAVGSVLVNPGDKVEPGQPIGRVGLSGLTEYPHLHFTVRHNGAVVDPFAYGVRPGSCEGGQSLWLAAFRAKLEYQERAILNAGFTTGPVTMELIEDGSAERQTPSASSMAIVAFVRAIGLKAGDAQWLVVKDPLENVIAENRSAPLQGNKAQFMLFAGKKRPPGGWDRGTYKATYVVERDGQVVLKKDLELIF
ncbi:M23 family metallopeptidase [Bradyrhizobium liaoningense]|uniref:M23 family metallopeptidase n=1 Tax=Bradyrhizobium liaoningense TaxID=43992 RepID=UPI001FEC0BA7|nr:M23 family metallopeptidase [Bradyrhizobium liaoningense]